MNWELSLQKDLDKLKKCELFLLDMDGTLYLGDDVFNGAIDFIYTLKELGKKYIYLTNNSSRAGNDYISRLKKMGFPCEDENIYTSSMATAEYLRLRCSDRYIYVVGTETFYNELKSAGLKVFSAGDYDSPDFLSKNNYGLNSLHTSEQLREYLDLNENTPVVCVGFDTELVYRDLDLAVHFLRKDAAFVAANPDWVCPMPKGEVLPDCGSICALLTASSGKEPRYIGKPNRKMVDINSSMSKIPNEKICCVGDRLYTDIAVAQNAGAVSVCVLSGECNETEIKEMSRRPDYVMDNVAELGSLIK